MGSCIERTSENPRSESHRCQLTALWLRRRLDTHRRKASSDLRYTKSPDIFGTFVNTDCRPRYFFIAITSFRVCV